MSLLLDALKQAEKAKQERTGEGVGLGRLEMESSPAPQPPAPKPGEATGEGFSIEPLDEAPAGEARMEHDEGSKGPPAGEEDSLHLQGWDGPEGREDSDRLDLEELASRLTDSTGRFADRPADEKLTPPADTDEFDPHAATMPSMKNVQQSLRDFYDGTGKMTEDEVTSAMASQRSAEQTGATTRVSQKDARNVFAAKGADRKPIPRRTWALLGVAVVVLLAGVGGWLWVSMSGLTTVTRPPVARAPLPAVPAEAPVTTARPSVETVPAVPADTAVRADTAAPADIPGPAAREPAMTPEQALAAATTPQASGPAAQDTPGPRTTAPAAADEPPAPAPAAAPAGGVAATDDAPPAAAPRRGTDERDTLPIRIDRSPARDPEFRQTRNAYEMYRRGDLAGAESAYRQVLQKSPQNRDALLGLAAVALKSGQPAEAQRHYLRLLALNPKDRLALAALTSLQAVQDPVQTLSRLKVLLDRNPDEGYLHFALGNVYAGQRQWPAAQQAFFNAYRSDKSNGDYAFNLAISLDQMGQHAAALDYYREALARAGEASVSFDRDRAQRRIDALAPSAPAPPS